MPLAHLRKVMQTAKRQYIVISTKQYSNDEIENLWGLCKVRLSKFKRIHKHTFYLHTKKCEFKYTCRNKNL